MSKIWLVAQVQSMQCQDIINGGKKKENQYILKSFYRENFDLIFEMWHKQGAKSIWSDDAILISAPSDRE